MRISRMVYMTGLWVGCFGGVTLRSDAQLGTDHFTINVPVKTTAPFVPVGQVNALVSLSSDSPAIFTFTDERMQVRSIGPLSPGTGSSSSVTFPREDSTALGDDIVTVVASPSSLATGDPTRNRYNIYIQLKSNFDANCNNKQIGNPNHYKVVVSSTATTPPTITGVCLESFDGHPRPSGFNSCTSSTNNPNFAKYEIPIPPTATGETSSDTVPDITVDPIALNGTVPQPALGCFGQRPPLDVALVLDKSGSMSTVDGTGTGSPSRMVSLHNAVTTLLNDWATVSNASGDDVGIVTFESTPNLLIPLKPIVTNKSAIETDVNMIQPGTSTSIGGGLNTANSILAPAASRRKVALLMSDGQQNTDPFVMTDPTTHAVGLYCENSGSSTCTLPAACTPTQPCPLSNHPQIYTVTLGPSTTVDPAINYQIANATLGYYLNSESNSALLEPFFLEMLQNFVRFNSYETVRLISENVSQTAPYSASVPISTTSHDAIFSLMWPSQFGLLRLTVTPPGGAAPIVQESATGFISLSETLPLAAPFDPLGDWKISIDIPNAVGISAAAATKGTIPFNFHLMTDDAGIKTELSVMPADYKAGDKIRLRAKVTNFGLPILGLGSGAASTAKIDLIKPGQSIGDLLSDSTASSTSSGPDPQSPAEAKLANTLKNDPAALKQVSDSIQLFDDGKPEHGDDVAGDGIYSALYSAALPGHYNFIFSIESTDRSQVRFSRQQLRTAYVRPFPDSGNTRMSSTIQRRNRQGVLSIVMTPRVKPAPGCGTNDPKCGRMGPGWANYFWFVAPGQTPVKANDNLGGTYTATVPFNGSVPPAVKVHFENVLAVIGDSVTPDKLPQPLNSGNELTTCCTPTSGRTALFVDAGPNLRRLSGNPYLGFSMNAGLEFMAANHLALDGIFGYHRFSHKFAPDPDIYQFSFNARIYPLNTPVRPFINGGFGGYKFGGAQTHIGANFGAGLLFPFSRHVGAEAAYNHHVINGGNSIQFDTLEVGLRYQF